MVDLLRECLKHKQKLSHDFICPRGKSHFYVYKQGCKGFIACFKKVFKFRRHYMPTIKDTMTSQSNTLMDNNILILELFLYMNTLKTSKPLFQVG